MPRAAIECRPFGSLPDGRSVEIYTLTNRLGLVARVMTYGSALVSLSVPDRNGRPADVVLGFDTLEGYLAVHPYFGGTIGRYANRIRASRFELDGVTYRLACNDGPNHLHGGIEGFDKRLWSASPAEDDASIVMRYSSPDGEEGYPGKLDVEARYALGDDKALTVRYRAVADRKTVINLTNHAYFNLGPGENILDHVFELPGSLFLPNDETLVPTGELRPVEGTPMDFRSAAPLRARMQVDDRQLRIAGGYDHTFLIPPGQARLRTAARVFEPASGRTLMVATTQPGVQFYGGNQLDGSIAGKSGRRYVRHGGFCLEPQHFPDSPNHPDFPSTVLEPGVAYDQTIVYRFDVAA